MMPDDADGEFIHVRCDPRLKRMVRAAAGIEDKSMSDYVRETLEKDAEDKGVEVSMTQK